MTIWLRFVVILTSPGNFIVSRLPKMDTEMSRLIAHMANYIFWLTPIIGITIWLIIRNAASII